MPHSDMLALSELSLPDIVTSTSCEILHHSTEQAILPKHQAASAKPISQILHRSPSRKRKKDRDV